MPYCSILPVICIYKTSTLYRTIGGDKNIQVYKILGVSLSGFSDLFVFFFSLHSSRNKFKAHSNKTTTTIYDVDFVDLLPSLGVTVKSSSGAIKIVQATIQRHTRIH